MSAPPRRPAAARALAFAVLWLVLMQSAKPLDLVIGAVAVIGATWASLRLLPPEAGGVRFAALLAQLPRFLAQSVRAGIDVARRALAPRMPLATGLLRYPVGLPRGHARNTFATITSLMPGTVPAGDDDQAIVYHCLDTGAPVLEELSAEERRLARVVASEREHG